MKMTIADDTSIDLGFRVQTQFISTNDNSGGDGESEDFFNVRRARFRLGGNITEYVKFFLQTDIGNKDAGVGADVRLIDAFINLHYKEVAQLIMGENMAPAGRQITTSSGGLMCIDRPNITNYNLTWGLNGKVGFNTGANFAQGDLPIGNDVAVRDLGATFFSSHSFSDTFHGRFYAGLYDGIDNTEDSLRFTARVALNFFDPEPGYYNLSTYLGKKKTVSVAASYDYQKDFAQDTSKGFVDYKWFEIDGFVDYPLGPGALTAEVSYQNLDLDNAKNLIVGSTTTLTAPAGGGTVTSTTTPTTQNAKETQGDGFYGQIGYYLTDYKVQPWFGYDYWKSDASSDIGSFSSYRFGGTYFFKGHNANVKVGYEYFKAKEDVPGEEDKIHTFVVGFYVTY
jgi:hypothetical protein